MKFTIFVDPGHYYFILSLFEQRPGVAKNKLEKRNCRSKRFQSNDIVIMVVHWVIRDFRGQSDRKPSRCMQRNCV